MVPQILCPFTVHLLRTHRISFSTFVHYQYIQNAWPGNIQIFSFSSWKSVALLSQYPHRQKVLTYPLYIPFYFESGKKGRKKAHLTYSYIHFEREETFLTFLLCDWASFERRLWMANFLVWGLNSSWMSSTKPPSSLDIQPLEKTLIFSQGSAGVWRCRFCYFPQLDYNRRVAG